MTNGAQTMAGLNGWRIAGWGFAAALLLTPAVAMQFSPDVNWTLFDFAFAAVLIGGTGLLIELAARSSSKWSYRGGALLALAATFLLIWINGAVGIIGNESNPANLVFLAIIGVAVVGALIARGRAAGMARAMFVAAGAQALTGLVVFAAGVGSTEPPGQVGLLVLIEFFAVLWTASGWLFRAAARETR
jgi:hypothetical protein